MITILTFIKSVDVMLNMPKRAVSCRWVIVHIRSVSDAVKVQPDLTRDLTHTIFSQSYIFYELANE